MLNLFVDIFKNSSKLFLTVIILSIVDLRVILDSGFAISTNHIANIIFLGLIVYYLPKVNQTLKYHGAEHKLVNAYNDGFQKPLQEYSRLADRCGTNLVVFFILVNIVLSFGFNFLGFSTDTTTYFLLHFILTYELFNKPPKLLLKLAMQVQRLTTREPEEKHLKAAMEALFSLKVKDYKKVN